mgnify:FL=1
MGINVKDYVSDQYELFIGGEFVKPESGEYLDVSNPATGEVLAKVAKANEQDVDKAVKAAQDAFPEWSRKSKQERSNLLRQIHDKLMEKKDHFATIETLNTGKAIRELSLIHI